MCTAAVVEENSTLSEISIQENDFGSFISPDDEMDKAFDESFAQDEESEVVMLSDDFMTSITTATVVLLEGSDIERLQVLFQFPQLLEHCPEETLQIMVPEICRDSMRWQEDVQIAAAEALYFVVSTVVPHTIAKRIVVASLRVVEMTENGDVFDAWGEILSSMIPQVDKADILSLIVPATIDRANSEAIQSRRLSARIIGALSDVLNGDELEKLFLDQTKQLCLDEDDSVRAMIAQAVSSFGAKVPLKVSETQLWPILREMLDENNSRVRAASLRALSCSAEAHKENCDTCKLYNSLILPVFLKECKSAYDVASSDLRNVSDDTYLMLEIFSEVFGYLYSSIYSLILNDDTHAEILSCYRHMVTCNGPTVRHWCAFNFPAVALIAGEKNPSKLSGVLKALCTDNDVETRATVSSGIHECTRILANGILRPEILHAISELLTDQSATVRMKCLKNFSEILMLFSKNRKKMKPESNVKASNHELAVIFTALRTITYDNWRTQELLAKQLDESAYLIPQSILCEYVAPILFQMARESTYLVRKASMTALISTIRHIPDVRKRDHILKHLRTEWARGKVYWTRIAYIDGCKVAYEMLSHHLFNSLFAVELMSMAKDIVPNVRIRVARMMPIIFNACNSKEIYIQTMRELLADEDSDVRKEARLAKRTVSKMSPTSAESKAEDAEKRLMEKKFFVHKKNRKSTDRPTRKENFPLPDINDKRRESLSFSNNGEIMSGATKTVVVHSVLGASTAPVLSNNKEPAYMEGRVLSNKDKIPEQMLLQPKLEKKKSSNKNSKDRKSSSMRLHSVRLKKRAMCGCFGGT